ncbi:S-layer homology domain-containing protein [Oscillibacter sp. ER4]|uniref:S-layer homology domain-containing protein n=1 Tax=Oscillibacter sp. ER4 TaxID=1519439 RepID=UPI0009DF6708|nr:S-layer homology domain-containing protein [Oscillibacter sp. ER4]
MKKLLAMVLALVMTLSLAVSANAAFKDADKVNETYAEAVDVLNGLGVFKGYEDGSFNPTGDITRAEVAAIVYRIYTGDTTDKQAGLYASYNKFSDMNGAGWAAGYIGYCANAEFVKGYPDGTFKPSGKVTGYEALAMILRAVGYDKNGEFSGAGWQLHVAQVAQQNGLLKNVKGVDLNKAASRELVAELLFQTITKANMVTFTPAFGYVTDKVADLDQTTLGYKTFELQSVSGEISKVSYIDKTTQFTYEVAKKNNATKTETKEVLNVDAGFEALGYEGYVWAVPGAKTNTLTAVSAAYLTGESLGSSTNGTAYGELTDKDNDAYIANDAARVYYNGVLVTGTLTSTIAKINKVGVKVDFIDNDHNGKTDVVVVTEYTAALVNGIAKDTTSTGSNAVEKNKYYFSEGIGGYKASAVCCADELALDDLVTVVEYNKAIYVKKADFVSDTFSAINRNKVGAAPYSYDIGDKTYLVATNSYNNFSAERLFNKDNLNKKVDIYTDPYGHIIYAELSKADVNYLFVLKNDHTKATTGLTDTKVVFAADAKEDVIGVNKVGDQKIFNVNEIDNHIYSYTENTNGSYALKLAHTDDMTASYTTKTAQWGDLGVNKNTKVIDLRTGKDNAVYTGYDEIPSLTKATICYIANDDDIITLAYLISGTNTEDLTADLIVFTTDANKEKKVDDETYFYLDVISDGKLVENYELTEKQYNYIVKLGVGEYVYDENGTLDSYIAFPEEWLDAKWSDGTIKIGDKTFKTINDDVVYKVLDITNGKSYDLTRVVMGDLGLFEQDGKVNVKAYLHYDKKNNAVTELYVIVGEEATGAATVTGTNPAYTYIVDNAHNKITTIEKAAEVLKAADFLREAKVNSFVGKLNDKGDGKAAATAFELVATGCASKVNAANPQTLDVVAKGTDMTVTVYTDAAAATARDSSNNGVMNFEDDTYKQAADNWFVFTIKNADGKVAYFKISQKLLSAACTVESKNQQNVKIEGTEMKVAPNVADMSTDAATALTNIKANLTVPAGATVSYADGKLTVTAECGDHVTVYTVKFVPSI